MAKAIRMALRNCEDEVIQPEHLGISLNNADSQKIASSMMLHDPEAEKRKIVEVLETVRYNKSKAAKMLQIDRKTLDKRIEKYGIITP